MKEEKKRETNDRSMKGRHKIKGMTRGRICKEANEEKKERKKNEEERKKGDKSRVMLPATPIPPETPSSPAPSLRCVLGGE